MKINEILTESSNTNLLIIDVQPEYANWSDSVLPGVQKMIEKCNGKIVVVYNDFGGGDELSDVVDYLAGSNEDDEYAYDEETDEYIQQEPSVLRQKVIRAKYYQKEFGFLRSWMDQGISPGVIIEVMREMYQRRVHDSRLLEFESMSSRVQDEINEYNISWEDDGIYLQDWVPVIMLRNLSPFYMMGGGRDECLREIELVCNAFNIRYTRIDSLIY